MADRRWWNTDAYLMRARKKRAKNLFLKSPLVILRTTIILQMTI
jgi:hypothetical protein